MRLRSSQHLDTNFPLSESHNWTIPPGLPTLEGPALQLHEIEGIFRPSLPAARPHRKCLCRAHICGGYVLDPRQKCLGLGATLAEALGHGYPLAGGLSQSAANDKYVRVQGREGRYIKGQKYTLLSKAGRLARQFSKSPSGDFIKDCIAFAT